MEKRVPAKVLGCLSQDVIHVILCPGEGMADGGVPTHLPLDWIPHDLRLPNSEFIVLIDGHNCVGIERLPSDKIRPHLP